MYGVTDMQDLNEVALKCREPLHAHMQTTEHVCIILISTCSIRRECYFSKKRIVISSDWIYSSHIVFYKNKCLSKMHYKALFLPNF